MGGGDIIQENSRKLANKTKTSRKTKMSFAKIKERKMMSNHNEMSSQNDTEPVKTGWEDMTETPVNYNDITDQGDKEAREKDPEFADWEDFAINSMNAHGERLSEAEHRALVESYTGEKRHDFMNSKRFDYVNLAKSNVVLGSVIKKSEMTNIMAVVNLRIAMKS